MMGRGNDKAKQGSEPHDAKCCRADLFCSGVVGIRGQYGTYAEVGPWVGKTTDQFGFLKRAEIWAPREVT